MEPATFGTGAVIGLNAIGKQDEIISELKYSPENSLFTPEMRKPSQFLKYYRRYVQTGDRTVQNWPFDRTVTVTLKTGTMGDLLSNMFLKINLPAISNTYSYGPFMGNQIFDTIEFYVGSELVQTIDDFGMNLYLNMYPDASVRNGLVPITLRKIGLPSSSTYKNSPLGLYIPLPLWFSRTFHPTSTEKEIDDGVSYKGAANSNFTEYFPLCAVRKQDIFIKIKFRPISWFTSAPSLSRIPEFTIVTEEIVLTDRERYYWTQNKFSQTVHVFEKNASTTVNVADGVKNPTSTLTNKAPASYKYTLQSQYPIKNVLWCFRNKTFTSNTAQFLNRLNCSSSSTDYFYNTSSGLISAIEIQKNNKTISFISDSSFSTIKSAQYFTFVDKFMAGLMTPLTPIYSYAFDVHATQMTDTGSADYSIRDKKDTLTITNYFLNTQAVMSNVYEFLCYTSCYKTLDFENGYLSTQSVSPSQSAYQSPSQSASTAQSASNADPNPALWMYSTDPDYLTIKS
jgi:Major capsid protein N-terminus